MGAGDGLLERKILVLTPRDGSGGRAVVDGETATPVGFCRRRPRVGWWRSFTRRVVAVHELLDESLLFTVRRCLSLFAWYEVRDADDQVVGWHAGSLVVSRTGRRVATREDECHDGSSAFVGPRGTTLARLALHGDDMRLTWTDEVANEPFLKMLLLAAALWW